MREELIEIAKQLKEWCEKYDVNYMTIHASDRYIMSSPSPEEPTHEETSFWMSDEE